MLKNRICYGIVFIIGMILCYVYQSPAISLFSYTLIFLPIASLLYMLWVYATLTYTQEVDKKFITKGESIRFLFSIHNESRWVYPDIEVIFYGVDSILNQYFESKCMSIGGREKKTYDYQVQCKYRGYYEIGIRQIYVKDFLGLFRISCKVMNPKFVTVYPRIIPLRYFPFLDQDGQNLDIERETSIGGGGLFSSIRPYVYGDSMKQVHWKMTAKKQELMMKERQSVSVSHTYLFLDLTKHPYDIERNTVIEDKLIECMVAVSYYCLRNSMPIQFIYHTKKLITYSAREENAFHMLYKELSELKFDSEIALEEVIALSLSQRAIRSNQVLITAKVTYGFYQQVEALVREGCHVIVVYVSPYEDKLEEDEVCQSVLKALYKLSVVCIYMGFEDEPEKVL